jgi:hypothetical protein
MRLIFEDGRVAECHTVKVTEGDAQRFAFRLCGLELCESFGRERLHSKPLDFYEGGDLCMQEL